MTERDRLKTILDGGLPDRIPWIPRIQLWYQARKLTGSMPEKWKDLSLREVERELRIGTPARDGRIFRVVYEGAEIRETFEAGKRITTYHTPRGALRSVTTFSRDLDNVGLPGRVQEYLLKSPEDLRVYEYMLEHARWIPVYGEYLAYERQVGEDGLPLVSVGDVPFHEFAQALAGYENAFYLLTDHQNEVERLLGVMLEVQRERLWPVVFRSPARLILHGAHLSSQMTPPPLFDRYVLPYYREFMPLAHESAKKVAMHADADLSLLLDRIRDAGWDMVECFVTSPMVPLSLEKARDFWGERVIIWGGLPSTLLSPNVSEDEFRRYVQGIFQTVASGKAFILGVADNVMPDSLIERVEWVSGFVESCGRISL